MINFLWLHNHQTIYIICSTEGQSIASIYNLSMHVYLGASRLGKYIASVYAHWLLTSVPYYIYYIPLWVVQREGHVKYLVSTSWWVLHS